MESISDKHSRILSHHNATLRQVVSALDSLSLKLEVAELPDQLYLLAIGKGSQKLLEAFTRTYKGEIVDGIILSPEPISVESIDQRLKKLTFFTGSHPYQPLKTKPQPLKSFAS